MSNFPRWLAALGAAALLVPAAAPAKKDGDRPGRGHGPPPWAGLGKPDKSVPPAETAPLPDLVESLEALDEELPVDETPLPAEDGAPAPCLPAAAPEVPVPAAKVNRGRSKNAKKVTYVVRGIVECLDGDIVNVLVESGNRHAQPLVGTVVGVAPELVIVNDEQASTADVWELDEVVFQIKARRGATLPSPLAPRRLIVQNWHDDEPPADELPAEELPDEPVSEEPPPAER